MKRCLECNKELVGDKRKKFCNHSCSATFNNKGVRRNGKEPGNCLNCESKLKSSDSKYCSTNCQQDYIYKEYIKRWKLGEESGTKGSNYQVSGYVKRFLFEENDSKCEKCGWSEANKSTGLVPLQVHHKDGDYQEGKYENLQLLCPNCHSLTDTFGRSNKNKGRRSNGHM